MKLKKYKNNVDARESFWEWATDMTSSKKWLEHTTPVIMFILLKRKWKREQARGNTKYTHVKSPMHVMTDTVKVIFI
jgi:hypothetical protein